MPSGGRETRTTYTPLPPVPSGVKGQSQIALAEAAVLYAHHRAWLNNQRKPHVQEQQGIGWQEHLNAEEQEANPEVVGELEIDGVKYHRLDEGEYIPTSGEEPSEVSLNDLGVVPLDERHGFLLFLSTLPQTLIRRLHSGSRF